MADYLRKKRKRVLLTLESRLQIIERLNQGENFDQLAAEYNIGRTTIRDIYNKRHEYIDFARNSDCVSRALRRKTLKKSSNHALDTELYNWFREQRSLGITVTKAMLIENAYRIHSELQMTEQFMASEGWLNGFKGRHGIEHLENPGEGPCLVDPHYVFNDSFNESYVEAELDPIALQEEDSVEDTKDFKELLIQTDIVPIPKPNPCEETKISSSSEPQAAEISQIPVKYESADREAPSCSSSKTSQKSEKNDSRHLEQFAALLVKEISELKSQKIVRNLKMNIMQLVYKAQEEDEA